MKRAERYETAELIQDGLLAASYKARDRVLDRFVLLKVLHPRWAADTDLVQRFRREALVQARLKHHNVVTVYDYGAGDDFYIASEFVEGETLEARLKTRGRLALDELRPILLQVVTALKFAHRHGVVHRDLKPANIMLTPQGDVKLADFGLAFTRDLGQLTQEGAVVGTPAYMSPNQARGQPVDFRTDIFTLGVVIYEALSGTNPFQAATLADSMSRVLSLEPKPLSAVVSELPAEVSRTVDRMLVKDPHKRLSDLDEVVRAFSPGSGRPAISDRRRAPNLRRGLVPLAFGLVVVGGAVLAYFLTAGFSRGRPAGQHAEAVLPVVDSLAQAASGFAHTQRLDGPQAATTTSEAANPLPGAASFEPQAVSREPQAAGFEAVVRESGIVRTSPAVTARAAPQTHRVRLTVSPWAEVMIDGQLAGVTPLSAPIVVSPGPHRIVLRHPAFPEITRSFEARDSVLDLNIDLNREVAMVDIRVTPWAVLQVDGRVADTTPLARPIRLALGEHVVLLSHPEFGVRTERIRVDSAGTYRFSYDLARK